MIFSALYIFVLAAAVTTKAAVLPLLAHEHSPDSFDILPGTPVGSIVKIGGVDTYVTLPPVGKAKKSKAVLFLTDIYGLPLVNNKLLADDFARAGFATYVPDYLNGDPVNLDGSTNTTAWFVNHGPEQTLPPLRAVIGALTASGIKSFGATGYCFGGLYTVLLSQTNEIKVGIIAHPSRLKVPADFEILKANSTVPLSIHSAELDGAFTPAQAEITDGVLAEYVPGYKRYYYEDVGHGFAVRPANASDPIQIAAKETAYLRSAAWFKEHL